MPASTPTYNRSVFYGVDNDAKSFAAYVLARASVTISDSEIYNISTWISSLKSNNVWKDLIEALPLRSTQNVGSSTVIYGLKQNLVGTLTGAGTWGTDGIRFSGATQYVSCSPLTPIINGQTAFTCGCVYNYSGTAQNRFIRVGTGSVGVDVSLNRNVTSGADNVGELAFTINDAARGLRSTGNTLTDAHHIQVSYDSPIASGSLVLDGNTLSESVMSTNTAIVATTDSRFGNNTTNVDHKMAIIYFFKGNIGASAMGAIATSYKTSMGQGLSLP